MSFQSRTGLLLISLIEISISTPSSKVFVFCILCLCYMYSKCQVWISENLQDLTEKGVEDIYDNYGEAMHLNLDQFKREVTRWRHKWLSVEEGIPQTLVGNAGLRQPRNFNPRIHVASTEDPAHVPCFHGRLQTGPSAAWRSLRSHYGELHRMQGFPCSCYPSYMFINTRKSTRLVLCLLRETITIPLIADYSFILT